MGGMPEERKDEMSTTTVAEELVLSESTLVAIRAVLKYLPLANVTIVAMTVVKSIGDEDISRVYEARVKTLGATFQQSEKLETCLVTVSKWHNSWRMTKINLGSGGTFTLEDGLDSENGLKLDCEIDALKAVAIEALAQTIPETMRRIMFDEITVGLIRDDPDFYEVNLLIRNTSLPQVPIDIVSVLINRSFHAKKVICLVHRVGGTYLHDADQGWKRIN